MAVERIFIAGPPGSGKSTLAKRAGQRTGLPVHELDNVARVGGGAGPARPTEERARLLGEILVEGRWIAEGAHLDWTEELLGEAQVIVWLDQLGWQRSTLRIVRRFVTQAVTEAHRRRGRDRYLRPRDYARRLRELASAIPEARSYRQPASLAPDSGLSQAETGRVLRRYAGKLVRCRTAADVDAWLESIPERGS